MVNFKDKKITHTSAHVGSEEYIALIKKGYVKVGVYKTETARVPLFWDDHYFDPKAKYIHQYIKP